LSLATIEFTGRSFDQHLAAKVLEAINNVQRSMMRSGPMRSSGAGPDCEPRRALEKYSPSFAISTVFPWSIVANHARSRVNVESSALARTEVNWGIGERGKKISCTCRGITGVNKGDKHGGAAVGTAGIIVTVLLEKTFLCFLDESEEDDPGL
jgi:hypothetical protein